MGKRKTSLSPAKFTKHPRKTAKRTAAKKAMVEGKMKKSLKRFSKGSTKYRLA